MAFSQKPFKVNFVAKAHQAALDRKCCLCQGRLIPYVPQSGWDTGYCAFPIDSHGRCCKECYISQVIPVLQKNNLSDIIAQIT